MSGNNNPTISIDLASAHDGADLTNIESRIGQTIRYLLLLF